MNLREKGAPICPVHKQPMWHEKLPPDAAQRQSEKPQPVILREPLLLTQQAGRSGPLPEPLQITYQPEEPLGENPDGDKPEAQR
jgi:hypothetical protein